MSSSPPAVLWPTRRGGSEASLNIIEMAACDRFTSAGSYYPTLARDLEEKFEARTYSFEEVIAETDAAFVCTTLDIEGIHIDDHASYVARCRKMLHEYDKAISAPSAPPSWLPFIFLKEESPA